MRLRPRCSFSDFSPLSPSRPPCQLQTPDPFATGRFLPITRLQPLLAAVWSGHMERAGWREADRRWVSRRKKPLSLARTNADETGPTLCASPPLSHTVPRYPRAEQREESPPLQINRMCPLRRHSTTTNNTEIVSHPAYLRFGYRHSPRSGRGRSTRATSEYSVS